jgi:anti-anti-sigma regulatory factor
MESSAVNGAGIAILTQLLLESQKLGKDVVGVGLSENQKKVFDIVGLGKLVTVAGSIAEALS